MMPPVSAPSGPRAHSTNPPQGPAPKPSALQSAKSSMESIPRPEVVKRVRTEGRTDSRGPVEAPSLQSSASFPPPGEPRPIPVFAGGGQSTSHEALPSRYPPRNGPSTLPPMPIKEALEPAIQRRHEETRGRREEGRKDDGRRDDGRRDDSRRDDGRRDEHPSGMPPPAIPSQTVSAQELRETARQSLQQNRAGERDRERDRDREGRGDRLDVVRQQHRDTGSGAPSPRVRSPSPNSDPPTRNPSVDSRGSGGRMRSDRMAESAEDKREHARDARGESSREGLHVPRRDSLTHTRERANRDRDSERERDSDRGRDRHGDRERDRGNKDRDRDRDRDRERGGDRDRGDRDRDRDRHRRDEKDRDRDRKEPSGRSGGGVSGSQTADGLPNRPDLSRARGAQVADDGLGKRRRGADDDVSGHLVFLY